MWNVITIPAIVLTLLYWALAPVIFLTRPDRAQNRRLALLFAVEGCVNLGGSFLMYSTDVAAETWAWQSVAAAGVCARIVLYLLFLATIPTPLTRPLARAEPVLWALLLVSPFIWLGLRDQVLGAIFPGTFAPWQLDYGPLWDAFLVANAVPLLYGAVVAVAYHWQSRGTARATQSRAYMIAFLVRDVPLALLYLGAAAAGAEALFGGLGLIVVTTSFEVVFALLLAYGILRSQLFDIDLRIRWTLKQGTVGVAFAAAFFVVSELAEAAVAIDGTLPGIAAAGGVALALRPLQRLADRLVRRAMPGVEATSEYVARRKEDVYRDALEGAREDGAVTDRDRAILQRLRETLGLTEEDARRIEASVA